MRKLLLSAALCAASLNAPAQDINLSFAGQTTGTVSFSWTGSGRFLVQRKIDLAAPTWFDVVSTTDNAVTVAKDNQNAFYRVVGDYTGLDVIPLTAFLSAAGEPGGTVVSPATGVATLSMAGNTFNYLVTYQDLTAIASAAHIHGPSDSQGSASVMVGFAAPSGTTGYTIGSATMTDAQRDATLAGKGYVNVHTPNFGGGEIRGQVMRTVYTATLNGANEKPTAVVTPATGTAKITIHGRELKFDLDWADLTSATTDAHIHGPADVNNSASVLQGFTGVSGLPTTGSALGIVQTTQATLNAIVDGLAYANIHTLNNRGGEIRGQLAPQ